MKIPNATEYKEHCIMFCGKTLLLNWLFSPRGEWADPGGSAIPGQPVTKAEQAPDTSSKFKNQFNIEAPI